VRQAVGERGPVVEDVLLRVRTVTDGLAERVALVPPLQDRLLEGGERRRLGRGAPGEVEHGVRAAGGSGLAVGGFGRYGFGAHVGGLLAYGARTSSHPWGRQACARGRTGSRLARSVRGTTPFGDDVRRPLVGRAVTGSPVRFY